jgi:hypothetical protein
MARCGGKRIQTSFVKKPESPGLWGFPVVPKYSFWPEGTARGAIILQIETAAKS